MGSVTVATDIWMSCRPREKSTPEASLGMTRAVNDLAVPERFHTERSIPSIDVATEVIGVSQGKTVPFVFLNLIPTMQGITNE